MNSTDLIMITYLARVSTEFRISVQDRDAHHTYWNIACSPCTWLIALACFWKQQQFLVCVNVGFRGQDPDLVYSELHPNWCVFPAGDSCTKWTSDILFSTEQGIIFFKFFLITISMAFRCALSLRAYMYMRTKSGDGLRTLMVEELADQNR